LYRDPDLKKKNVGVTLMASLETIARRTGIKMLRLRVRIENTRAIDLYRRVGYVEMKRSDVFIQMKKDIMS
jgi:ribosomal protein S18 acetylase RimI-like enzyme